MTEELRKLIIQAYQEHRLATAHIDLQVLFPAEEKLLAAVRNLNSALRPHKVSSIWVAAGPSRYDTKTPYLLTDVKGTWALHLPKGRIRSGLGAIHDDAAVIKGHDSAFYSPDGPLDDHLQKTRRDTLFITGVNALECVAESIQDAVLSNRYNIIALCDCINIGDQSPGGYKNYSRWLTEAALERNRIRQVYDLQPDDVRARFAARFHIATSGFVIETLRNQGVQNGLTSCKSAELAL